MPGVFLLGDAAASKRYCAHDAIELPIDMRPDGTMSASSGPCPGVTLSRDGSEGAAEHPVTLCAE